MCGKLSSIRRETAIVFRSSIPRRRRQMRVERVLRMKRQRDETLEAAGLVLQFAQSDQMIHAFFERLDVTVKHRRVRTNSHLVDSPRDFQPSLSRNLVSGDQRPRAFREDFSAASRTAAHPGFTQFSITHSSGLRVIFAKKSSSTIVNAFRWT